MLGSLGRVLVIEPIERCFWCEPLDGLVLCKTGCPRDDKGGDGGGEPIWDVGGGEPGAMLN